MVSSSTASPVTTRLSAYLGTLGTLAGERFKKPAEKVSTEADALRPKRPPRSNGGYNMAIAPTNEREADEMALKLFCLLAFILVGLITAGIL